MKKIEINITYGELFKIVNESNSFVDVTLKIGLDPYKGNNRKNIERLIKRNNISVEHFETIKKHRESKSRYDKKKC